MARGYFSCRMCGQEFGCKVSKDGYCPNCYNKSKKPIRQPCVDDILSIAKDILALETIKKRLEHKIKEYANK